MRDSLYAPLNARYTLVYAVHADVAPTTIVLCGWRIGRSALLELCASNARMLTDTQRRRYVLQGDSDDSTNTNDGRLSCFNGPRGIISAHTKQHAGTQKQYHTNDSTAYKFRPHSKSLYLFHRAVRSEV
ncbi:hypothetical protein BDN70DRAFT_288892 [Pholiota conissans]|uniref:Uncharacterized protein n=1 Tax=Pholiota conissans TaxID=109636 RepID=A0A9P6CWR5_9AGAR|nr:hypothetical protein BDN70DRAFT_288892 [Pholiota conissans]